MVSFNTLEYCHNLRMEKCFSQVQCLYLKTLIQQTNTDSRRISAPPSLRCQRLRINWGFTSPDYRYVLVDKVFSWFVDSYKLLTDCQLDCHSLYQKACSCLRLQQLDNQVIAVRNPKGGTDFSYPQNRSDRFRVSQSPAIQNHEEFFPLWRKSGG